MSAAPPPEPPLADLSVLIPAAGRGERLGMGPKALLPLHGRPLVSWLALKARGVASEVLVAVAPEHVDRVPELCPGCRGLPGGATRQETVGRLVEAATRPWVLVQDAARPFASPGLMRRVAAAARETGAAGAFLQPDAPVARLGEGRVIEGYGPEQLGLFQAPQAFERGLLGRVLEEAEARGWSEQSLLQLFLRLGLPIRAVPGERANIKLTTPEDWKMATSLTEWLA